MKKPDTQAMVSRPMGPRTLVRRSGDWDPREVATDSTVPRASGAFGHLDDAMCWEILPPGSGGDVGPARAVTLGPTGGGRPPR